MRIFSYRNKRALRRALLIALLAVVLIGLLILARISYLGRYAVYSPDGVYFDKTQKLQREDVPAAAPAADPEEYPFETILSASSGEEETGPDTVQLQGYYISTTMLANGVDEVRQALQDADGYNAVLIDVKSPLGNFYYSTDIADAQTADADISACDALIRELTETPDLIVVARVPAFSDPNFVAKHYSSALTTTSGDLWMDERRCYWLRPDSIDAQSYLAAIALELDSLGFDEVLFDNFYVPSDSSIAWDTEAITPVAALEDCAENLTANLTDSSIRLALRRAVRQPRLRHDGTGQRRALRDRRHDRGPGGPRHPARLCHDLPRHPLRRLRRHPPPPRRQQRRVSSVLLPAPTTHNVNLSRKKVQPDKLRLHLLFMAVVLRQLAANLIPPYQAARTKTPVR